MEKIYFIVFGLFLILSGCSRDTVVDPNSTPITTNSKTGLYILCEGSGTGTSKLSFYDLDSMFYENIFSPGILGSYPDGMIYDGTNILITEQGGYGGAGKIYRVDTSGKEISSQIIGINPYSLCISMNKIYVTHGKTNSVSILDFNNLTLINTINVGFNPQEIISYNNKVFVCNEGNYSEPFDSTVYVIDAQSDVIVDTITVQRKPASIALSRDNKLLIGCYKDDGKIYKVDPSTNIKLDSFSVVGGFYRDISIDKSTDDIFFINFLNNIVKLNLVTKLSETMISNPSPAGVYYYGYIFDSKRRIHYVANARTFNVNGLIHKYDINGVILASYITGHAPRRFLLLDN